MPQENEKCLNLCMECMLRGIVNSESIISQIWSYKFLKRWCSIYFKISKTSLQGFHVIAQTLMFNKLTLLCFCFNRHEQHLNVVVILSIKKVPKIIGKDYFDLSKVNKPLIKFETVRR